MNRCIEALNKINKDDLNERMFYEQVMSALQNLDGVQLTDEDAIQLKEKLQQVGCVNQATWKKEKIEKGEPIKEVPPIWEGIKNGQIETAVNFISQLLGEPSNVKFSVAMMFDWGGPQAWVNGSVAMREQIQAPPQKDIGTTVKRGIIEFVKEQGMTKSDIAQGKRFFDRLRGKKYSKANEDIGKDESI